MEVEAYRDGHYEKFYKYIIDEPEIKATLFFTWKGLAGYFNTSDNGKGVPDKITVSLETAPKYELLEAPQEK